VLPPNGSRLSCGASAGGRKRLALRHQLAGAQTNACSESRPVSFKRRLGGCLRRGSLRFTPVTNPRIALGCRPIPVVDAKNESVLSIVKNARVVFGEANKCMPASGIDAKVDRLWERVVDLPHR